MRRRLAKRPFVAVTVGMLVLLALSVAGAEQSVQPLVCDPITFDAPAKTHRAVAGARPGWVGADPWPESGAEHVLPPLAAEPSTREPTPSWVPLEVGSVRPLSLSPSEDGSWIQRPGGRAARITVRSTGAVHVRLHLDRIALPPGATIVVYSPLDAARIYKVPRSGAATYWTPPLKGDTAILEYFEPATSPRSAAGPEPFRIDSVSHAHVDLDDRAALREGSCHNDLPDEWQVLGNAVGRILFVDGGGEFLCTGTLLNNAAGDFTPYFLTANHCISSSASAASVRVWWFYDEAGQSVWSLPHTDGARLLATRDQVAGSDFTLLMLQGTVPRSLTWSGWTTVVPDLGEPFLGIHHPGGAYKRISYGDRATPIFCPFNQIACPNYIPVDWNTFGGGATEGGSSGSGLWLDDPTNPLLVGQLWGGFSDCSLLFGHSYYGRFDVAYQEIGPFLQGGSDDDLEQNDDREAARRIDPGVYPDRIVKWTDEDWYRVIVPANMTLAATIELEHDHGDIDLELHRGGDGDPVDQSADTDDDERVEHRNSGALREYLIRVHLFSDTRNGYDLNVELLDRCVSMPGDFHLLDVQPERVVVDWSVENQPLGTTFDLERVGPTMTVLADVVPPHLDDALVPGQSYCYRVRANQAACSPSTTEWSEPVCAVTPPDACDSSYHPDSDGDGFGSPSASAQGCAPPAGHVANDLDCDDGKASVHPGATELCNELDDDCDGAVDDGVRVTYYRDADDDGHGDASATTLACSPPQGYLGNSLDCDDANAGCTIDCTDGDGDGFCVTGDCVDTDPDVHPDALEVCDNLVDENCDGHLCICPALLALQDDPDVDRRAAELRRFRDQALLPSAVGQRHVDAFYRHAAELAWIVLRRPELGRELREMVVRHAATLEVIRNGGGAVVLREDLSRALELVDAFAKEAGPELATDLRSLKAEIQDESLLRELKVVVGAGERNQHREPREARRGR